QDAEAGPFRGARGVAEWRRDGRGIAWVRAGQRAEDQAAVVGGAGQRTELIQGPAEGHRAVAAHPSVGGPQAADAAVAGRRGDRAPGLRANREGDAAGAD